MQKMHAESLIASKLNTHYGSPPTSRYNHGPYQQKHTYKSPLFHPRAHKKKYSITAKITYLSKFFIQFKLIQNKIIFYYLFERTKGAPTSQFKR